MGASGAGGTRWAPPAGLVLYAGALFAQMGLVRTAAPVLVKVAVGVAIGVALVAFRATFLRYGPPPPGRAGPAPTAWAAIAVIAGAVPAVGTGVLLADLAQTWPFRAVVAVAVLVPVLAGGARSRPSRRARASAPTTLATGSLPTVSLPVAAATYGTGLAAGAALVLAGALLRRESPQLGGAALMFLCVGELVSVLRARPAVARRGALVLASTAAVALGGGVMVWVGVPGGRWVALAGVLASPIGVSLFTQQVWDRPGSGRLSEHRTLAAGLVVVAGAYAGLSAQWGSAAFSGIAVLALSGLVWLIAANVNWDVLFVVLALMLIWAVLPRQEPYPADLLPSPGEATLVALGDSYLSGEGARTFVAGTNQRAYRSRPENQCRRAPGAWPVLVALGRGDRLDFRACSGAKAANLWRVGQYAAEGGPQLQPVSLGRVTRVVVSIGGNDARFSRVVQACMAPGDCAELASAWDHELAHARAEVRKAFAEIARGLPGVPVAVVPYPLAVSERRCGLSPLSSTEHLFVNSFITTLNRVIAAEATAAGFTVLTPVERALAEAGERICDRDDPDQWGVNLIALNPTASGIMQAVFPANWIHNSVHPNHRGHQRLADVIRAALAADPATLPRWGPPPPLPERPPAACAGASADPCKAREQDWTGRQLLGFALRSAPLLALAALGAWVASFRIGLALDRFTADLARLVRRLARYGPGRDRTR